MAYNDISCASGEYIMNKSDINFLKLINELSELSKKRVEFLNNTVRCINCGATKHKSICEYCGT